MIIMIILTVLCVAGMGISIGLAVVNCLDKKLDQFKKKIVWILLTTALTIACGLTMYRAPIDHIGDGQIVAVIYKQDNTEQCPLYYSEKHDEYFVILINQFNPINLAERCVVDKANAERYIELYNELHSIDMKGN